LHAEYEVNGVIQYYNSDNDVLNDFNNIAERRWYAEGLLTGVTYKVQVTASNVCGTSPMSNPIYVTPGAAPTCINPTTNTVFANNNQQEVEFERVQCAWNSAIDNGFAVSSYKVSIMGSDNQYHNIVNMCDEGIEQRNFNNNNNFNQISLTGNTCTLSKSNLRGAPFSLPELAQIRCQVVATNAMGDSTGCVGGVAVMPVLARVPDAPSV
jgi:fibronectin type 3 domain-containing protein